MTISGGQVLLSNALCEARRLLDDAQHLICERPPEPAAVRVGIDGAHEVATALARMVGALAEQAPTALDDDHPSTNELLADLRALHRYLRTSALLLEPAARDGRAEAASAAP